MRDAVLFLFLSGCATATTAGSGDPQPVTENPFVCDYANPQEGMLTTYKVKNGRVVRETLTVNGEVRSSLEYRPVDDVLTEAYANRTKVGTIRRGPQQWVTDWLNPPRRIITTFENGRVVRTDVDDLAGDVAGVDGEIDAVETYEYDGVNLATEERRRAGTLVERRTHEYEGKRRARTKVERFALNRPAVEFVVYTYEGEHCLATVQPH